MRDWMPGMSIAGAWYSSGTFWTGAGAAATLVVGLATVAVTYLTRFARQRLDYRLRIVVPLLTAPAGVRDDLELRHRGVRLTHPYIVAVELVGRGRRDIPHAAFDNGQPIRLDLGVPIVELLRITATDSASATPEPPVRVEGTALLIGPALIGRRQRIVLTCLMQNRPQSLRCSAPLPNAQVRRRDTDPLPLPSDRLLLIALLLAVSVVSAIALVAQLLSG
ncbi:hypothetical protein AB0H37_34965 [Actinomadura sp. NPDC023710]|uniref:hypothetical protein n=1 Tax=Actinomadura sp. NPDC023710 TaxID=3158219 RepID=UPI003411142B